jgi:phosphoribosyl 1,2-cyclic phosphodiesterase
MKFCSLASGSSGNCQYVGGGKHGILIDAGLSGKYIKGALEAINVPFESIKAIVVTHEHTDHIKGACIIGRKLKIPVYGTEGTLERMRSAIKTDGVELRTIEKDVAYSVDGDRSEHGRDADTLYFKAFSTSHDASDPVGYSVFCNDRKITTVTDIGVITDSVIDEASSSDFVLLEANHDEEMLKMGSYPFYLKKRILSDVGHLSNEAAGSAAYEILKKGRTKSILLGHLSRENNFPELAYETVASKIRDMGVVPHVDIRLDMAFRDKTSNLYVFE